MWFSRFVFTLMILSLQSKAQNEWHQIPSENATSYWLLAFEEAEFIRKDIGNWLPIAIFKTTPNEPLQWKLDDAKRKNHECEVAISFLSGKKQTIVQKYTWFDRGPDEELKATIQKQESEVYLIFRQQDGTKRRIWISRSNSVKHFSNHVSVSKAMLLWKWNDAIPVDL